MSAALELVDITRHFGNVVALSGAHLVVRPGTVHALLGENGAGKSTLMRLAFGMLRPHGGRIRVRGKEVRFRSPLEALGSGIGMVQQHFSLVPAMTVAENVALGGSGRYRPGRAVRRVEELARQTGLSVSATTLVRDLSVGAQQRVEILKALARETTLLILDEPTAVLAPSEIDELLRWIRAFAAGERAVVLITHKLREALAVADDITVLRDGHTVLSTPAGVTSESELVAAMLGSELPEPAAAPVVTHDGTVVLRLRDVSASGPRGQLALHHASFEVHAGELLGVAAVEGAGQHELLRVLAGRLVPDTGQAGHPADVAFIPEDRHRDAAVLDFSLTENLALRGLARGRWLLPWGELRQHARVVLRRFEVRASSPDAPLHALSGGNQQRFILGRELDPLPAAVVAENPTRGLDVKATKAIHARLRAARDSGAAVVVYSSDVDEVLALADRVVVVHAGRVIQVPVDRETVGRAMLGALA